MPLLQIKNTMEGWILIPSMNRLVNGLFEVDDCVAISVWWNDGSSKFRVVDLVESFGSRRSFRNKEIWWLVCSSSLVIFFFSCGVPFCPFYIVYFILDLFIYYLVIIKNNYKNRNVCFYSIWIYEVYSCLR